MKTSDKIIMTSFVLGICSIFAVIIQVDGMPDFNFKLKLNNTRHSFPETQSYNPDETNNDSIPKIEWSDCIKEMLVKKYGHRKTKLILNVEDL